MATTTFLCNEMLWERVAAQIKSTSHVEASIAYIGQGGAKLLPLRKGHRLVVDMSLGTVKAGSTDPREVEKLIRRGVQAFTRRNLHAKLIVADKSVIAGSANVSTRSKTLLDEAAIWTNDLAVVARARTFIERLCTEPIRPEYLKICKEQYRPPRMNGGERVPRKGQRRVSHPKLWIVNLTDSYSIPDAETARYEKGAAKARRVIKDAVRSETDSFHWPHKPRMADELEPGDWLIMAIKDKDKNVRVCPPGQLLFIDNYVRNAQSRKTRWVFHLEVPVHGQTMNWKKFRAAAGPRTLKSRPTTQNTSYSRS